VVYSITNSDLPSVEGDPRLLDDRGADPIRAVPFAALAELNGRSSRSPDDSAGDRVDGRARVPPIEVVDDALEPVVGGIPGNDRLDIVWNVDF